MAGNPPPDVNDVSLPDEYLSNMDAVVELLSGVYLMRYQEEMHWRIRSMLERAYEAGKAAGKAEHDT